MTPKLMLLPILLLGGFASLAKGWKLKEAGGDFTFIHPPSGLSVPAFSEGGLPLFLEVKEEQPGISSLRYYAGQAGTKYFLGIEKKALFDPSTGQVFGTAVFRYVDLESIPENRRPRQPIWTWQEDKVTIDDPNGAIQILLFKSPLADSTPRSRNRQLGECRRPSKKGDSLSVFR